MRWAVLALALALCGCGGSPKTQFYTLLPISPAGRDPAHAAGPPLQVGQVHLPGVLDRASLVTLGPGPQVAVSDNERWAAPLDELIRRTLTEDLRARLGSRQVLAPDDPAVSGATRTLILAVQRFSGDGAGQVVLQADWTLAAGNPPKAAAIHHVDLAEQAASADGHAVATAMSKALAVLADDVARSYGSRVASQPRGPVSD